MKTLFYFALVLICGQVFAQTGQNEPGKDFGSYKNYMMDRYRSLEDPANGSTNSEAFAPAGGFRGTNGKMNYNHINSYPAGDSRNYMKDQVLQKVGTLAQALADTAGSAFGFDSANQLRSQAKELNATGDPTFKQAASILNQEATAIDQGDRAQAQSLAGQIAPMATLPVSSGYKPTQEQNQFVQALGNAFGIVVSSLTSVLGVGLAGQFLSALGILNGSGYQNVLGGGINSLLNGQAPSSVASNTGVNGVNLAGGQVSGVMSQNFNKVLQPVPQGSNNGESVPKP